MSPTVGHVPLHADYRAVWFPDEPVSGQPTNLGYVEQDLSLSFPIWQDSENEWSASSHVRAEVFHTGAMLPDTHEPFPNELWNIHLGTNYRHLFDNGWIGGASVNLGSASDKPFSTINEMVVGANLSLRVPQGEHNAWLFTLNYSTNSEFLNGIPIPGVAYFYAPVDWFQATIGVPFASIIVRPLDDLTLQLSYAPITTIHARATYRLLRPVRIYTAFDWGPESYFRAERLDERERLFYYDKRLTAGMQVVLSQHVSLDLSGGYDFDRFYFEGKRFTDRGHNRLDLGEAPYAALRIDIRF